MYCQLKNLRPGFICVFALGLFLFGALHVFAQGPITVELFEPSVPFLGGQKDIAGYVSGFITLLISVAVVLAVLQITIAGFTWMTSDAVGSVADAKDKIWKAVQGLLLAGVSFIVLQTINPALVRLDFINSILQGNPPSNATPENAGGGAQGGCTTCATIPAGVPVKNGICQGQVCQVDKGLGQKLQTLNSRLSGLPWHVTEGYPPDSNQHQNPCHYNGTCVDANLRTVPNGQVASGADVQRFINAAIDSSLTACYEVSNDSSRNSLISSGVSPDNVVAIPGAVPHFSVYNGSTRCSTR